MTPYERRQAFEAVYANAEPQQRALWDEWLESIIDRVKKKSSLSQMSREMAMEAAGNVICYLLLKEAERERRRT